MGILFDMANGDFSKYMNPPEDNDKGYIENYNDNLWLCCPYCGKRQFIVQNDTVIKNLFWKCKGSNCKREFEVNV